MSKFKVQDIRNVAFLGHSATGKTTLADLLLFKAGIGSRAGSVDEGSSLLDIDDEEKDRKSSVSSTLCHFERAGKRFNLIDTPGSPDFLGQVNGALRAVETAVIAISAGAGIEVNTRRVMAMAEEEGVARVILLNKCDMDNVQFQDVIDSIQEIFGQACIPFNVPIGIGTDFKGVVSTLRIPDPVPDSAIVDPNDYNQVVMDAIVEADEELMERYLEEETLTVEEAMGGITKALVAGTLIPIFCCSSKADIGVDEFADALANFALCPSDLVRSSIVGEDEVEINQSADEPLIAQVFKTRIDPFVSKMSYIRIFAGKLAKDLSVANSRTEKGLRITQLLEVQGGNQEPVDNALPGDIVAVVKMEDLKVGDTLGSDGARMSDINFPQPMVSLAVEPKSRNDQSKISGALQKIEDEDQTFRLTREPQTKELVMAGMSDLHLQIITDRLAKRDKVEVVTRRPKVPYRETVQGMAEGSYRHKKQSGGAGQFGEVHFRISACPHGVDPDEYFKKGPTFENLRKFEYDEELNSCFVDRISGGSIPNQFIPAILKGIKERMNMGVIAGYQVQDVVCELYFGKDHPVDSNETAFKTAARMCFRNIFQEAKPVLLEPIVSMEITVPGDKLGDITSDLNTRRGRMEGMDSAPGGQQVVLAKAPLAEVLTYSRSLSSMTGGQGSFTFEFSHYEMMPANEQSKVIAAAKKEEEDE